MENKKRLIDAEKLFADIINEPYINGFVFNLIKDMIKKAKTIDAVPVEHGHWVWKNSNMGCYKVTHCSICDHLALFNCNESYEESSYCPNCGAKMDGGN